MYLQVIDISKKFSSEPLDPNFRIACYVGRFRKIEKPTRYIATDRYNP